MNDLDYYKEVKAEDNAKEENLKPMAMKVLAAYLDHILDPDIVRSSSIKEASSIIDSTIAILKIMGVDASNDTKASKEVLKEFKKILNGEE